MVQPTSSIPAFLPSCPVLSSNHSHLHSSTSTFTPPCPYPRINLNKRRHPTLNPIHFTPTAVTDVSNSPPETRSAETLDPILQPRDRRRFIFFGGKGGVGKTSSSAAVAIKSADEGLTTLIISTDPAHSLGDALRCDLSDGALHKVDPDLPLYAVESDTAEAVAEFRSLVASLNAPATSQNGEQTDANAGKWSSVANRLGLQEFSDVLQTIPPGADELIALVQVLDLVQAEKPDVFFDRIIIDTAPTGHTLRFLTFPDFLDKFLEQALKLREKLNSARGMIGNVTKMFMGWDKDVDVNAALENASKKVAAYREKMIQLSDLFRDPERAEFVVVTIPTVLAVAETKRLVQRLWDDGIWVRHVVINQILPIGNEDTISSYLSQIRKGQTREIAFATEQIADEFGLNISIVPRFDTEVRGVFGLQALAATAFQEKRKAWYGSLFDPENRASNDNDSQFVFVGGKGGVGKTSMSATLAVKLASEGFKTLVISTDPAHSLGDALQLSLEGGAPVPVDLSGTMPGDSEGSLFGMEIDTQAAIVDFQTLATDFVAEGRRGVGVDMARNLGLEEFAGLLDNAPPGIDELVALTQVLDVVKFGDFDRVVVDTAPTGHTLRLLSFPEFLDSFLGKVMGLKRKLDSAADALRAVVGRRRSTDVVDKAAAGVARLRDNMIELRNLVSNEKRTQFAVVTVPTALAMAESERLVRSLKKDKVMVKNLIINQVVAKDTAVSFVKRVVADQEKCIESLADEKNEKGIGLVKVPFYDVEVRGVFGLRAMAQSMFSKTLSES